MASFALQVTLTFVLLLTLQIADVAARQPRSRRQTVTHFNLAALKDAVRCPLGSLGTLSTRVTSQLAN